MASSNQDAFHRRALPPPVARGACALCTWDHEEPVTGIAARVLVAFATATRLPAPVHALSSRRSQQARPTAKRPGPGTARRLLQPIQPASTSAESPEPRLVWNDPRYGRLRAPRRLSTATRIAGQALARPEGQDELGSPPGRELPRATPVAGATQDRHTIPTKARLAPSRRLSADLAIHREPEVGRGRDPIRPLTVTSRVLTGQGPAGSRRPAPPGHCAPSLTLDAGAAVSRDTIPRAWPQPDPLGHLSS